MLRLRSAWGTLRLLGCSGRRCALARHGTGSTSHARISSRRARPLHCMLPLRVCVWRRRRLRAQTHPNTHHPLSTDDTSASLAAAPTGQPQSPYYVIATVARMRGWLAGI